MRVKRTACITLDLEADPGTSDPQVLLLQDQRLLARYRQILEAHRAPLSAFLVTSLIHPLRAEVRSFCEHTARDIHIHSHAHDPVAPCTPADIARAASDFESFFGRRPTGYRAPYGLITRDGLRFLAREGFAFDASVFPSIRFDRYGYCNLGLPQVPFRFEEAGRSILELPFATLRGARLIFSISYVKLLGWPLFRQLLGAFRLPPIVVIDAHPYDFYYHLLPGSSEGWKRAIHMRNAERAFDLFECMLRWLRDRGYEFATMSELAASQHRDAELARVPLAKLRESRGAAVRGKK